MANYVSYGEDFVINNLQNGLISCGYLRAALQGDRGSRFLQLIASAFLGEESRIDSAVFSLFSSSLRDIAIGD